MRIYFDHQIFSLQNYGGISRYFVELMREFSKIQNVKCEVGKLFSNNEYLSEIDISHFKGFSTRDSKLVLKGKIALNNFFSLTKILRKDFDVFHPTFFDDYYLNLIRKSPVVITVYDLIHEIYSDSFKNMDKSIIHKRKKLLERADKIIAISESTKVDLINYYNVDKDKIDVIYLASSLNSSLEQKIIIELPKKYFLFVGNRGRYKNFIFFIESIAPILKENRDLKLVCAGGSSFSSDENKLMNSLGIINDVIHYKFTTDNELVALYKNARAFFFPTLYEGFGIPILEAYNCGCPVIVSNTSSLPEVAGDAALYIDPQNGNSIINAANSILNDTEVRNTMIHNGYIKAKEFSWEITAKKHIETYKSIIDNRA